MATTEPTPPAFEPYVPAGTTQAELTLPAVITGAVLGIIFGASSLYLVLKVGLTVSASIPVAVLSITLFRVFSRITGFRRTTILENNIVQTTGSAGESIAFGVGLTMPALLLLGFDIDIVRVMVVGVLGGLLGILMMIPLRRAFIVQQHDVLTYPEGKAAADVLKAGERGGDTAKWVFLGFGLGGIYQFLMKACLLWKEETEQNIGMNKAAIGAEMNPALVGVGYIIGPKISSIMVAGGVLAYLVLVPLIAFFGDYVQDIIPPAKKLIRDMGISDIRNAYILYIGAGAVAAGGIISMFRVIPMIIASVRSGVRDFRASRQTDAPAVTVERTSRDMPLSVVMWGSMALVLAIAAVPQLGLGLSPAGLAGAFMIVMFGFLFTVVSSRLTGELGSSSNPISGMMVATLLLTCLALLGLEWFGVIVLDKNIRLAALTIGAVVSIAASNGGTTSQALKTGYLVGATPISQQYAILIGSLTSALVIGVTLLLLNEAGTIYSKLKLPEARVNVAELPTVDRVHSGPYNSDSTTYHVLNIGEGETLPENIYATPADAEKPIPPGRYLVNDDGSIAYFVDPAVNGKLKKNDDGTPVSNKFDAPKTRLIQLIIDGILSRQLPWTLVLLGVLIAVTMELCGVASLPFAVGVYLPIQASMPIFIGGMIRYFADRWRGRKEPEAESDASPGVLLSSGYIAGASIAALVVAFLNFTPGFLKSLNLSGMLPETWADSNLPAVAMLGLLTVFLLIVGSEKVFRSRK